MDVAKRPENAIETHYLQASSPEAIQAAAEWLRQGRLVVFPTDTLYGIGADAFNATAVAALYQAKSRPLTKGIPILLADLSDLGKVAHNITATAHAYIERFWPGPLTLIVPKQATLPAIISPNEGIAVRIPDSDVARAVIRAAGGAVATSSANRSGLTPAQTAEQALAQLDGWVTAVLDGGPSPQSTASTVLDCTVEPPQILRPGPITAADLSQRNAFP